MISKILIPTDFSPASWNAAQVGLDFSVMNVDTTISFLHIYPLSARYAKKEDKKVNNPQLKEMKMRMNLLASKLSDKSEDFIENVVLSGNVEYTLLKFIRENHFDLVIIGINSNGQNNEIGSHTVSVIKESGIPVLIVPNRSPDGFIAS